MVAKGPISYQSSSLAFRWRYNAGCRRKKEGANDRLGVGFVPNEISREGDLGRKKRSRSRVLTKKYILGAMNIRKGRQ